MRYFIPFVFSLFMALFASQALAQCCPGGCCIVQDHQQDLTELQKINQIINASKKPADLYKLQQFQSTPSKAKKGSQVKES